MKLKDCWVGSWDRNSKNGSKTRKTVIWGGWQEERLKLPGEELKGRSISMVDRNFAGRERCLIEISVAFAASAMWHSTPSSLLELQSRTSFLLSWVVRWLFFGGTKRLAEGLVRVDWRLPLQKHQAWVQGYTEYWVPLDCVLRSDHSFLFFFFFWLPWVFVAQGLFVMAFCSYGVWV